MPTKRSSFKVSEQVPTKTKSVEWPLLPKRYLASASWSTPPPSASNLFTSVVSVFPRIKIWLLSNTWLSSSEVMRPELSVSRLENFFWTCRSFCLLTLMRASLTLWLRFADDNRSQWPLNNIKRMIPATLVQELAHTKIYTLFQVVFTPNCVQLILSTSNLILINIYICKLKLTWVFCKSQSYIFFYWFSFVKMS